MAVVDRVREVVAPLVEAASVNLYDVEYHGGTVRVLVDADGGIDLESVARISRTVSRALDSHDFIAGRYTLEVSSPGLERPLRTAEHFRGARGVDVKIKTRAAYEGPRRLRGQVSDVDDDAVWLRCEDGAELRIGFDQLESARTVFEWGPGSSRRAENSNNGKARP